MTREEIISVDPDTGETYDEPINDLDKTTIDACNGAIELLEQEPFINKPCISKGVCNEDKIKVLDKISAEIERQDNWLMIAGYNAYNVYIAFNSIKRVLKEARDEEW